MLYIDLVEDARLLYDRGDFLKEFLDRVRGRLQQLGAVGSGEGTLGTGI